MFEREAHPSEAAVEVLAVAGDRASRGSLIFSAPPRLPFFGCQASPRRAILLRHSRV